MAMPRYLARVGLAPTMSLAVACTSRLAPSMMAVEPRVTVAVAVSMVIAAVLESMLTKALRSARSSMAVMVMAPAVPVVGLASMTAPPLMMMVQPLRLTLPAAVLAALTVETVWPLRVMFSAL